MMDIDNRKDEGAGKRMGKHHISSPSLSRRSGNEQQMKEKERV